MHRRLVFRPADRVSMERQMHGTQFTEGFQLSPIAKGSPKALILLLRDPAISIETLTSVAERWAVSVPAAAFVALEAIERVGQTSDIVRNTIVDSGSSAEPETLGLAARGLARVVAQELRARRLDASQLVLVGFGSGGTLALRLVLHQGWSCAGVLAFAPTLINPPPRTVRRNHKIRLIDSAGSSSGAHAGARDVASILVDRGIDVRRVRLGEPMLSEEAIRHGALYLAELVATAQWGGRLPVTQGADDV
jgi:predicted esterase